LLLEIYKTLASWKWRSVGVCANELRIFLRNFSSILRRKNDGFVFFYLLNFGLAEVVNFAFCEQTCDETENYSSKSWNESKYSPI
jgi:hypothetical protein